MAGPSQPQVFDEAWSDDRVKSFLDIKTYGSESEDFHILLKAYRGMRADDFARFLTFFKAAGRDLDAKDNNDQTLWQIVESHRHGQPFLDARQSVAN
jgi:hypothetical protein